MRAVLSSDAVTMRDPSGLKAAEYSTSNARPSIDLADDALHAIERGTVQALLEIMTGALSKKFVLLRIADRRGEPRDPEP
jgi:hypothetical protein